MAHPKREHLVPGLVSRLGIDDSDVVWDERNNRWDTGRRAWMSGAEAGADFTCIVQDDAIVCRDFVEGLGVALDHVPADCLVQPFLGKGRERKGYVEAAEGFRQADERSASWILMPALMWGVVIVAPTHTIPAMLTWCNAQSYPEYDRRVGQFYRRRSKWSVWHTHPSLVDHRGDGPSLSGHGNGIVAHRFIGQDASALDVDWSGDVVVTPRARLSARRAVPAGPAST